MTTPNVRGQQSASRIRLRRLRALKIALVAVVFGLAVTGLVTWWAVAVGNQAAGVHLSERAELLLFEVEDLLGEASLQTNAVAGLFRASDEVTRDEFAAYVADIGLIPGVVGIGYVQVIAGEQIDGWLAQVSSDVPGIGLFEYNRDGDLVMVGERDLHLPFLYFEPAGDVAVGLDLAGNEALAAQLTDNLSEGIELTGFVGETLPEPLGGRDHVLMGRAVTHPGSDLVHDLVVSVVDVSELIDRNVAGEINKGLIWSVADATDVAVAPESGDGVWQRRLDIAGRSWLFTVVDNGKGGPLPGLAALTLSAGLAITLLVGLVVVLVIGRIDARNEVRVLESISDGKDDFLTAVSHRLRTPLTSVVGFSEVLRDSDGIIGAADRRELVSTIAIQATELGHLFDNLLTVTRESERSSYMASRVALAVETQAVLDTAEPERRDKVRVMAADRDLVAAGDPAMVRQILRNLLSNATDFGEHVEVEVAGRGLVAKVSVRDDGLGVPPDRVRDIFELYGSRGQVGQPDSMGVGLYVSRRLARRMSGDVTYRRSGGWTVFELTLPAMPTEVVIEPIPDLPPADVAHR